MILKKIETLITQVSWSGNMNRWPQERGSLQNVQNSGRFKGMPKRISLINFLGTRSTTWLSKLKNIGMSYLVGEFELLNDFRNKLAVFDSFTCFHDANNCAIHMSGSVGNNIGLRDLMFLLLQTKCRRMRGEKISTCKPIVLTVSLSWIWLNLIRVRLCVNFLLKKKVVLSVSSAV